MAENILFYGFVTSCIIYGIFTFLVKAILKSNGYQVVIFNIDFSDFKNLRSLAMQEKKYRFLYLAYILFSIIPLSLIVIILITLFH
ncbi:MAG: hypothetical protein BWX96_02576 [Bacteroidetes bacterium ADurb.Bin145]|jgi:hypothetical protein|nr:MAG: hypothetical protein BWX96_02576 [Bacteroidetes bacterium ADurb.Bin145]